MIPSGLDDAFLRYINANPQNQRRVQSFYLPFFLGRRGLVADLACGHGDFVKLLTENGVRALGVDSDRTCCREARKRGVDILCDDVFAYLKRVAEESLSGVFSAHLVEHLPYEQVLTLTQQAYRALEPGGIILLATPNVRGLYAHLESFYMHFGHVTFYHPKLLSFFLDHSGFSTPRVGENPVLAHPLWPDAARAGVKRHEGRSDGDLTDPSLVRYDPRIRSQYRGVIGRVIGAGKTFLARLLVRPLLDQAVHEMNEALGELRQYATQANARVSTTHERLMDLDRSVECYVYATKGDVNLDLPPRLVGEVL